MISVTVLICLLVVVVVLAILDVVLTKVLVAVVVVLGVVRKTGDVRKRRNIIADGLQAGPDWCSQHASRQHTRTNYTH